MLLVSGIEQLQIALMGLLCSAVCVIPSLKTTLIICLGKRLENPKGHQDSLQKNLGRAGVLELKIN